MFVNLNVMGNVFKKMTEQLVSNPVTVSFMRLLHTYTYNKEKFILKRSSNVFSEIYKTDFWNSLESKSGGGSTLEATKTIREELPFLIAKFSVRSMLDIPCGDFNWMKTVKKDCNYIGGDIVASVIEQNNKLYSSDSVRFIQMDITSDNLPQVDLIFCKDCLQHLSNDSVAKALKNIKKSGSRYLLVTSYPKTWKNHDIYDGDYRPLNLLIKPFSLKNPLLKIRETSKGSGVEIDKTMYLFSIDSIESSIG